MNTFPTAAHPAAEIKALLLALLLSPSLATADDDLSQPFLGVKVIPISEVRSVLKDKKIRPPTADGLIVVSVTPYSPAQAAGVKQFDIIKTLDSKQVKSVDDFESACKSMKVGDDFKIAGYSPIEKGDKIVNWRHGQVVAKIVSRSEAAVGAMASEIDKVNETTTFAHKDAPAVSSESAFVLYFVADGGVAQRLMLRIQYVDKDWIFFEKVTIKAGLKTLSLPFEYRDQHSDHGGGRVWEWYNLPVKDTELKILEAIRNEPKVTIRYTGRTYYKDRELRGDERQQLLDTWLAYRAMGGK